jgi:hypothetical protein
MSSATGPFIKMADDGFPLLIRGGWDEEEEKRLSNSIDLEE